MEKITLATTIKELLEEHPELGQVFARHDIGLDLDCLGVTDRTLEDASYVCGFDAQVILEELNEALEESMHGRS